VNNTFQKLSQGHVSVQGKDTVVTGFQSTDFARRSKVPTLVGIDNV
jgi:hypothetical protein